MEYINGNRVEYVGNSKGLVTSSNLMGKFGTITDVTVSSFDGDIVLGVQWDGFLPEYHSRVYKYNTKRISVVPKELFEL